MLVGPIHRQEIHRQVVRPHRHEIRLAHDLPRQHRGGRVFDHRADRQIGIVTKALAPQLFVALRDEPADAPNVVDPRDHRKEESGRAELVRAAAVGPWSALAAVGIVAVTTNTILGLGTGAVFVADGQEVGPSLLYGSSVALCGIVFAAIALLCLP